MSELLRVERREITLSCMCNDEPMPVLLMARVCGGLAIHKGIGRCKGHTLTHLQSSVSLVTGIHLSVHDQELALKEIAAVMDWSKPHDEITSMWGHDQDLYAKVRRLFARLREAYS